jgi:hypothetical protein
MGDIRTQNFQYPSKPLSFKSKIAEQNGISYVHSRFYSRNLFLRDNTLLSYNLPPENENLKKPLLDGYPKEPEFQNSDSAGHQVGPNDSGSQNFSLLVFKG